MGELLRLRFHNAAWAIVILFLILVLQEMLSTSLAIGQLTPDAIDRLLRDEIQNQLWQFIKFIAFVPAVVAWLLNRRQALILWSIVSNSLLTFQIVMSETLLVLTLGESSKAFALIRDTLIVAVINILVFSLWYWLMDSPFLKSQQGEMTARWDFLFPQRATQNLKGYQDWEPNYIDYLFLAVVTTMSFSPADTLPLSRRAKLVMGTQAILAFATITILAARALSILK